LGRKRTNRTEVAGAETDSAAEARLAMSLREGAAGATEEEMADWIREGKVEKRRKRGRFERRLREER
jgi:hypothetical protein